MSTLVSTEKKFVFIHLPKCAGTSVASLLEPYSYPWLLSAKPIRHSGTIVSHWTSFDPFRYTGKYILPLHANAAELIKRFPAVDFSSYFRFTIVRSPWSLLVSVYEFNRVPRRRLSHPKHYRSFKNSSFKEFLRTHCSASTTNLVDHLFMHSDGSISMDYVAKQETLASDMPNILDRLGISVDSIPRKNITDHDHYASYYDDWAIDLVSKAYERDIRAFGYTFGD